MFKSILLNISAVSTATEVGNDTAMAVENVVTTEKIPVMDLALQGGWVMLVLLALLILAVYISIERYLAVQHAMKDDSTQFMNNIREYIHKGEDKCYAENAFNEILPALNIVGYSYENDFIDEIDNMADHERVTSQIVAFDERDAELFGEE